MGDLVFLYDNKYLEHHGKFQMHWLGPYVIIFVSKTGEVKLDNLNGKTMEGLINSSWLKLYRDSHTFVH